MATAAPTSHAAASSSHAEAHAEPHEPHAHHLKYGHVEMSGFAPPEAPSDDETEDGAAAATSHDPLGVHPSASDSGSGVAKNALRRKLRSDRLREHLDAEARRIHSGRRYLFRRPRPLQYFRGSVLVRDNSERSSGRLELFFDLTFVGIIAVLAQQFVLDPTGAGFVRYLITYTAAYMIWHWMREMFNAFYKDDFTQRLLVLFVMACLILYGNNAIKVQDSLDESSARAVAIGSYLVAEAAIYSTWMLYSFYVKPYRAQIRAHTLVWLMTVGLMIGAIFTSVRAAIALSIVAMVLEWHAWVFFYSTPFKKLLKLRYSSALAIEHEIERYNDFFTIVTGEFVYSLFADNPTGTGFHIRAGKAIMALMIAFCFQLFYMNGASSKQITHPLRKSVLRAIGFFTLHLPIVSALTLCGDALADFVKEDRVSSGVRYLACESFALGTIGLWMLAMLEHERDQPGELWFPKWARLTPRLLTGIVAVFLPLTYQAEGPPVGEREPAEAAAEGVHEMVRRAAHALAEGAASAEGGHEELVPQAGFAVGADMTTGRILGVLTAMIFFALLWETVTSLDGPNAPYECVSDELLERAKTHNGIVTALSTPLWRGYPHFMEPGADQFDRSHQRDHSHSAGGAGHDGGPLDHEVTRDSVLQSGDHPSPA